MKPTSVQVAPAKLPMSQNIMTATCSSARYLQKLIPADKIAETMIPERIKCVDDRVFPPFFEVDARANKHQIKEAVELIWPKVDVQKVRVMNMPAKRARRWRKMIIRKKSWKKAVVTLAPGQRLEIFEGV